MIGSELYGEFINAMAERLRTRSMTRCSRWAVKRRIMPDGKPYSLEKYPYIRAILDSRARKNWVMKGSQTGLSEAAFTIAFFEADRHGKPVLYYFPTEKMAQLFSKSRFKDVIEYSPYLKNVVTISQASLKELASGGRIYIAGSNSDASVRGISSGRLFFDELDIWPPAMQYQAEERASGQDEEDILVWGFSTPRIPHMGVHKQFLQSTQEHFMFDCPHCRKEIELLWEDSIEICGETPDDPRVNDSYFKCRDCQQPLPQESKSQWLANGRWRATNPEADPAIARGFWISQMYSPTVSAPTMAIAYLRGYGDEEATKQFHNHKLGLPYLSNSARLNDGQIDEAMEKFAMAGFDLPYSGEKLVTLGIDQGGSFHHWVAVAWEFEQLIGDPNDRGIGTVIGMGKVLQDDWQAIHDLMRNYHVWRAVIDYFPEPTNARQFARTFRGGVYLCQYVKGAAAREIRITEDDYGANIVRCDRTSWLEAALGRVRKGRLRLPLDISFEFRQHLKALVRTTNVKDDGQPVAEYINTDPDHYAHALNYAEIGLKILDPALHQGSEIIESVR